MMKKPIAHDSLDTVKAAIRQREMLARTPKYCLQCDDATILVHETKDVCGDINGVPYDVPAVTGWHCPVCGEIEFTDSDDSGRRVTVAMEAAGRVFRERQALLLRATRKRLGLSQAAAGRLFGGGATAFSEYEHGKTQPHKSTLLLFRLLERHPELLNELETV